MNRIRILTHLENLLSKILKCNILPDNTYLAGGTAVYFYLKHRISIDLDFFTPTPFNTELLVHKIRACVSPVQIQLMEENTLILFISNENIKLSLFLFPYPNIAANNFFALQDGMICPLASIDDIIAMKAVAIAQRGSIKDFFDLFLLINQTGYRFEDILNRVMQKYSIGTGYAYQLKKALVYFDDAEKEMDTLITIHDKKKSTQLTPGEWRRIQTFFTEYIQ